MSARPVAARSPEMLQWLGETSGDSVDLSKPRTFALAESEVPAWLNSQLSKQEMETGREACKRRQTLIFRQTDRPRFVAATWDCEGSMYSGLFTLHRIDEKRTLVQIGHMEGGGFRIVEPSGQDIYPDHPALLFVEFASGGSGISGYHLHVFRLDRHVSEVTPEMRTVWAEALDGDVLAASSDGRWDIAPYWRCSQCVNLIPVIFAWKNGRFIPACQDNPRIIEDRIRLKNSWLETDEAKREMPHIGIETHIETGLLWLQIGRYQEGLASYTKGTASLKALIANTSQDRLGELLEWQKRIIDNIDPFVMKSPKFMERQCPLTAARDEIEGTEKSYSIFNAAPKE